MSFYSDFGHDIPPDDWPGGGYSGKKYSSRPTFINYGAFPVLKHFIKIHHETDKAYLFELEKGKTWIPKSRISSVNLKYHQFTIPTWLSQSLEYLSD